MNDGDQEWSDASCAAISCRGRATLIASLTTTTHAIAGTLCGSACQRATPTTRMIGALRGAGAETLSHFQRRGLALTRLLRGRAPSRFWCGLGRGQWLGGDVPMKGE